MRQLLHRIRTGERPARLYDRRRNRRLPRRDRRARAGHVGDRLHRRRALHERRHHRHGRRGAGARLSRAGAHQRHAADAAAPREAWFAGIWRAYGGRLTVRVSLDHYTPELHEKERGPQSWSSALAGTDWLARERRQAGRLRPHLLA